MTNLARPVPHVDDVPPSAVPPVGVRRVAVRTCLAVVLGAGLFGTGCVTDAAGGEGSGADVADGPGDPWLAADSVAEEVRDLPKSARGNMAEYTVRGKRYRTLDSAVGFRERGIASWYGAKFHGRATSSGEPFDMHAMTAAHRHLPLPTFLRVTRVDDGRSVVVKVNDRGPFADDRILDLSYAAAARLDMLESGTAEVVVEALSTHAPADTSVIPAAPVAAMALVATPSPDAATAGAGAVADVVQLGAFSDSARATELARRVGARLGEVPRVEHDAARALWRVRIGPLADAAALEAVLEGLAAAGIDDYALVRTVPR